MAAMTRAGRRAGSRSYAVLLARTAAHPRPPNLRLSRVKAGSAGAFDLDHRIAGMEAFALGGVVQRVGGGAVLDLGHGAAFAANQKLCRMLVPAFNARHKG